MTRQPDLYRWSAARGEYYEICGVLNPIGGVCESRRESCGGIHMRAAITENREPGPESPNQDVKVAWVKE